MPPVLTMSSTVRCGPLTPAGPTPPHIGVVAVASAAKLRVRGQGVLLESSIVGKTITGCMVPEPGKKCASVTLVTTTRAVKLKVNGAPVILEPLTGSTEGNPVGTLGAQANHTKLHAI